MGNDVASDLIENIEGYQQLLTTLSLAVSGGIFALLIQILIHNASNSTKVRLKSEWIILAAVALHLLSIGFGIFTKSALVASVPALHAIQWGTGSATEVLTTAGLDQIAFWATCQVILFFLGTAILFIFLICNRGALR